MSEDQKTNPTAIPIGEKIALFPMSVGSNIRTMSSKPDQYRLARKKDGTIVLQGAFQWSDGMSGGFEWKEIPMVDLETGQFIFSP